MEHNRELRNKFLHYDELIFDKDLKTHDKERTISAINGVETLGTEVYTCYSHILGGLDRKITSLAQCGQFNNLTRLCLKIENKKRAGLGMYFSAKPLGLIPST